MVLLGGLEEFEENIKMIETEARLSAIFREWGRADFDEVREFLETEPLAKKYLTPDRRFADELILAALIGYGETDPANAWEIFLTTQNYTNQRPLILNPAYRPYAHNVAAEEIMRSYFKISGKEALNALREIDPEYRLVFAPGLRAILSESNDAGFRSKLLKEFLDSSYLGRRTDAGIVCAGEAEHDPKSAWDTLQVWARTQSMIGGDDPEMHFGIDMVQNWSRRQPIEALRFVADLGEGEEQFYFSEGIMSTQLQYRPELVVEILEIESLKKVQEVIRPEQIVESLDYDIPWPLIEENVPLPREERLARLKQAVEASSFSKSLKDRFLAEIDAAKSK